MSSPQQVLLMGGKNPTILEFLSPSTPTSFSEGSMITFVVSSPTNTTYYWAAFGVNGATPDDASAPSPPWGSFTVSQNIGSFTLTLATDVSTPETNEGFFVRLYATQADMLALGPGLIQSVVITITDIPPPPGPVFVDFDYMIVRFKWTNEAGTDLDTRTSIINSNTTYDGITVGFCRNGTSSGGTGAIVGPPGSTPGTGPYFLWWAGDGTGAVNVEATLLDFKQMDINFSNPNTITVQLRAFWWGAKYTGLITLELTTYSGGTMQWQNYDFINVGGNVVNTTSVNMVVDLKQTGGCPDGLCLRHVIYTTGSRDAVLVGCAEGASSGGASTVLVDSWVNPDISTSGV